jgi:glycosyltransferase involved in cell wall biosynthesis
MRVLHFAKYAFVRTGGIERHVEGLTRSLAARGVDVTILAYDPSGDAVARWVDGVRLEPVPTLVRVSSQSVAPSLVARARRLAHEGPFDVVHQHWPDPLAHLAASLLPSQPTQVVTWHTDIVRQRVLGPLYQAVASRLLATPDAIICSTQAHLKSTQIARFAPAQQCHVIPFGIDVRRFEPTGQLLRDAKLVRERYGGRPIVFALGRHVYYKGFDVLIRAMARVPAVLLLGGEGPLTPDLSKLAAGIGEHVKLVGQIPDAQLPAYFHACDVFCLPSVAQTETFGLVQAEAMACGKPVVNTALSNGVNELAPHELCALTAPPADMAALAQALCRVLAEPATASVLGTAGRERVYASFTEDAMADRTLALYEAVAGRRRRAP